MTISFAGAHVRRSAPDSTRKVNNPSLRSGVQYQTKKALPDFDDYFGLQKMTLDELINSGTDFRFPDNPSTDYASLLRCEESNVNSSPLTKSNAIIPWTKYTPRVAIIGGGMSGMMTAFQLKKTGMDVTIYEAGGDPNSDKFNGAGRIKVSYLNWDGNDQCELGAMRFPNTSYLYWSYVKKLQAISGTQEFLAFPNPLKVPTAFRGNANNNPQLIALYDNPREGQQKSKLPSPYKEIVASHLQSFNDYRPTGADLTTEEIKKIASSKETDGTYYPRTNTDLDKLKRWWTLALADLGTMTYREFLIYRGISLPNIEIIGYIGMGTGGFSPLFDVSAVELFRLFIWDFDAEFSNPFQYKLPGAFSSKLKELGVTINYNKPVLGVGHYPADINMNRPTYQILTANRNLTQHRYGFDYIVYAMTHVAAQKLLSGSQQAFRDAGWSDPKFTFPFYDDSAKFNGFKSEIRGDLELQTGINAVKIFQRINSPVNGTELNALKTVLSVQV